MLLDSEKLLVCLQAVYGLFASICQVTTVFWTNSLEVHCIWILFCFALLQEQVLESTEDLKVRV